MRATGHNWPDPPQRCSMHLFPKTDCLGHETYTCYNTCRTKTLGKTHVCPDLHNRCSSTCFQSLTAELHRKLVIHLVANTSTTDWWQQCLIWLKTWQFIAPLVWNLILLVKESARICRFPGMYFPESESFGIGLNHDSTDEGTYSLSGSLPGSSHRQPLKNYLWKSTDFNSADFWIILR